MLDNVDEVADRIQSLLEKLAEKDANLPQADIDARQRLMSNLVFVREGALH